MAQQAKLPPTVPALGALMVKGSVQVKRAAVDALAAVGTAGAMQQMERAIEDPDRDVRVAAVESAAVENGDPGMHLARLGDHMAIPPSMVSTWPVM